MHNKYWGDLTHHFIALEHITYSKWLTHTVTLCTVDFRVPMLYDTYLLVPCGCWEMVLQNSIRITYYLQWQNSSTTCTSRHSPLISAVSFHHCQAIINREQYSIDWTYKNPLLLLLHMLPLPSV